MSHHIDSFLYLQHLVRVELREALTDLDLTPVQSTVLQMLAAAPGSSSADLARRTQVTAQTMHRLLSDLERRGLRPSNHGPGTAESETLTSPEKARLPSWQLGVGPR